ncbi:MAG: isoleucine--tRNA ligase [Actinobacteria bacterium]|nr:MAG: isoleucine--tRNA ligase [Actinomycetota bacterium]
MELKETLNLPKTDFPMRANLAAREPEILKFWQDINLYGKLLDKRKDDEHFVLHDGPPYANGDIHVGHTLNKVLKDIIVRFNFLSKRQSPYIPGWDCHGQPIEHNVEKSLGTKRAEINQADLRKLCRDYALEFVDRQRNQFKRLGVIGDWENPYLTLDHSYEATNIEVFGKLYEKGMVYKGRKPIHWCIRCKTALAEAEIEYEEETSPSIYMKFPVISGSSELDSYPGPKYFMVWTTTPWTLPANVAVAIDPDARYSLIKANGEIYILLADMVESVIETIGISKHEEVGQIEGKKLEGTKLTHPLFDDKSSTVVLADFISHEQGTGCVHIAPGHGQEDYLVGLKYKLDMPMPVDKNGIFTKEAGKYEGQNVNDANKEITKDLEDKKLLLKLEYIKHSYPHCWRCKSPVIFRATKQWFISMDKGIERPEARGQRPEKNKKTLRKEALEEIKKVKWIPGYSQKRIEAMVSERPDWCISRQRAWGVPIPAFYCNHCEEVLVTKESIASVVELFINEGADAWFIKDANDILAPDIKCSCGERDFRKESDILDVWFESGVSSDAVLKKRQGLNWPADLYLEGSDQHRGWFQSSLLTSVGANDQAPYKVVLTHGFTVDDHGRKMSKSLGNVIDPLKVIKKSGADILRLWVAHADFSGDIAISDEILQRVSEAYRRLRNTARFMLGNLYDFNISQKVLFEELTEIDRWALMKLSSLIEKVTKAYQQYRFYQVYHLIYNFSVVDLSAFYLDVIKDRLYTDAKDSKRRRSAQSALYEILIVFAKLIAPIMSFTADDIWRHIDKGLKIEDSVQLSDWPTADSRYQDKELEEKFDRFHILRDEVLKALEQARIQKVIGNPLEAKVVLSAKNDWHGYIKVNLDDLAEIFIVSVVELVSKADQKGKIYYKSNQIDGLEINIEKTTAQKCERCWRYLEEVGTVKEAPNLCMRCADAVKVAASG